MFNQIETSATAPHDEPSPQCDVGYANPPKNRQWKKGQSGNPAGKAPGAKSFKSLLLKAANKIVVVKDAGGKSKKKPLLEAVVSAAFQHGIKGNTKLALVAAKLMQEFLPTDAKKRSKASQITKRGNEAYMTFYLTAEDVEAIKSIAHLVSDENEELLDI
jgi:hypothetical protein